MLYKDMLRIWSDGKRILFFIRDLSSKLQELYVHITSAGKCFNEVTNYVKKVEGLKRDVQAKKLAKRSKNSRIFQGSYVSGSGRTTFAANSGTLSSNFKDAYSFGPTTGAELSFDCIFYNF